jgi:hypothetical protein
VVNRTSSPGAETVKIVVDGIEVLSEDELTDNVDVPTAAANTVDVSSAEASPAGVHLP